MSVLGYSKGTQVKKLKIIAGGGGGGLINSLGRPRHFRPPSGSATDQMSRFLKRDMLRLRLDTPTYIVFVQQHGAMG